MLGAGVESFIRIERDPAFWAAVAGHPEVAPHIGATPDEAAALALHPLTLPLASAHGGFLFRNLDGLGFVFELHTLFTPEGWGREVALAAREAFARLFDGGAAVVVTHEQHGWWRAKPPLSHGWAPAADWRETPVGLLRMWTLSAQAWRASALMRRRQSCP
ncbi:MAG: hypothetical protein ACREEB_00825 [Caulobacteraceae bacterium]